MMFSATINNISEIFLNVALYTIIPTPQIYFFFVQLLDNQTLANDKPRDVNQTLANDKPRDVNQTLANDKPRDVNANWNQISIVYYFLK